MKITRKFLIFAAFLSVLFLFKLPAAQADVANIVPNAKHANDTTGEAISEITADDSAVNPDTLSSVVANDGTYTVDKGNIMQFTAFDTSAIPSGSLITGAVMHFQFGAENGYNGTNPVRYDNGSGLTTTGITPTDITGFSADQTFNLFSAGVDTLSELQNVDAEFTNNDAAAADAIHFDYLYITVTYTPPITTIGNGTNPSNISIAPGASATDLDTFTLQTNTGSDTVTAATITLASSTSGGLSLVAITSNDGLTTYCSQSNPASDSVSLSACGISVSTALTSFKIRITPKSHVNMPAPPGSTYSVTGTITSFTSANSQSGSDTGSATVTIDNASPANVTGASGTAGDSQVALTWTNPADSDFHSAIVLRRAGTAVSDTPTEGASYIAGNIIGNSTVACVVASPADTCNDTGLTNGTAYHYRIYTRDNNVNYSATGVVPTGSPFTPAVPPDTTAPAAITDLTVSSIGTTTVTLTWTAPGDDGNSGTASSYDVRYSTSIINSGNFSSATQVNGEPAPLIAGTVQSKTISGLASSTTYYFAMKTSDEALNISGISNVPNAMTLNPVPVTTSISPASKIAGDSGFTLTVNGADFATTSVVRFNSSNRTTAFASSTQLTAAILSSDLTSVGTFSITAFSPTPGGGVSNAQTFTVNAVPDTTAPAAVADLAAGAVTASSIALSWTAPGDDGNSGTASSYDVRYSTSQIINDSQFNSATQAVGEPTPSVAGSAENFTVTGLSGNTAYYFALKTSDEVPNTSSLSNSPSGTTSAVPDTDAPAAVTDLSVSSPTASSLDVSWTAPGDDINAGTAATYDLRYSTSAITGGNFSSAAQVSGEPTPSAAGSFESMTVTGLSPDTAYYFALKTSDEVPNTSAISNAASGTTTAVSSVFIPAPSPGSSVAPTRIVFSGKAWPGAKIEFLRKSGIDLLYRNTPIETSEVSADGSFRITSTALLQGEYFFALRARDRGGRETGIISFTANLISSNQLLAEDLFLPPTLGIVRPVTPRGEDLIINGYAFPGSIVEIFLNDSLFGKTAPGSGGLYSFSTTTLNLAARNYSLRARQIDSAGRKSDFSPLISFAVSSLNYPQADFNGDNAITIADWSIFLSRWGSKDQNLRGKIDMDGNGRINIADLSIFLKAFKK